MAPHHRPARPPRRARTGAAAALVLLVPLLCACAGERSSGGHLAALRDAGQPRRIQPRLSIALNHEACEPAPPPDAGTVPGALCRGAGGDPDARSRAIDIQDRARRTARARVDPEAMRAVALVDLLWNPGDAVRADSVVEGLEAVARLAPTADGLADLSAAYIVRAGITGQPGDLVAAIDAAHRALVLDPDHIGARFNAALAEQRQALDRVAREDWDAYLAADSGSAWAAEARRHRDSLVVAAANSFSYLRADSAALARRAAENPQEAREIALDQLFPAWADTLWAGDAAVAEDRLRRAESIGAALARRPGGDAMVADLAAAARRSPDLAPAFSSLSQGQRARARGSYADAEAAFSAAERLAAGEPVLRTWCAYWGAVARYLRNSGDRGRSVFASLAARTDGTRYPVLAGRAYWSLTTLTGRQGDFAAAMAHAASAERLFRSAGETASAAFVHYLGAEAAWNLGDREESARRSYRVLHDVRGFPHSMLRHNQLYVSAQAASGAGLRHAAVRLLDESVAMMDGAPAPLRVEPLLRRAEARAALGLGALAREDLDAGAPLLDSLPDPYQQEWNRQDQRM
ncbi:MAG TPA: hypothetical protein VNP72_09055, partial [Longimicrobium sp.]|nr:hypothetical protein [Longimicrobium sp.]